MNKTKFFIVLSLFFFILSCILVIKLSSAEEQLIENIEQTIETTENVGIEITTSEETTPATEETEITTTEEIGTEIETNVFETEEVKVAAMVVTLVEEPTYTIEETIYIPTEETEIETSEEILEVTEVSIEEPAAEVSWGFTEEEIDMITNVVMHEVGGFYDTNISITATYADGRAEIYSSSNLILQYHAQVLINQYNSSIFPNSLSKCIINYWSRYLANPYYYNHNNTTWQYCRDQVVYVINNGCNLPDNVYGATCDPYFSSRYDRYSQYAKVYWETDWKYGTFYYYEYN